MSDIVGKLEELFERLVTFERLVKKLKTASVSGTALRNEAKGIHRAWLPILGELEQDGSLDRARLRTLRDSMDRLRKLADRPTPKASYRPLLRAVIQGLEQAALHPLIKRSGLQTLAAGVGALFGTVSEPHVKEYLEEAATCARHTCFRAATVLAWCAAASRIQDKLGSVGLPRVEGEFDRMRLDQGPLFRSFNKSYKLASPADIQEIPDAHLVLLCRFLGWFDDSQYKQLRGCLDLRNACGHPGSYQLDGVKLQVYFADLVQLVFGNATMS
jgi:hypothetical protein